jgi:hypothetical protein
MCYIQENIWNMGYIGNNILCSTYAPADQGMSISTQKNSRHITLPNLTARVQGLKQQINSELAGYSELGVHNNKPAPTSMHALVCQNRRLEYF